MVGWLVGIGFAILETFNAPFNDNVMPQRHFGRSMLGPKFQIHEMYIGTLGIRLP